MDDATERTDRTERADEATATTATADAAPAEAETGGKPKKKQGSFLRELPVLLVIALALALLIKTFLVQAFFIPSPSMERTLLIGDRVLVNKLVYKFRDIHRGEIVVFNGEDSFTPDYPVPPPPPGIRGVIAKVNGVFFGSPSEKDFIKRVIGLPGDVVECCDERGRVKVNGVGIDEPYLHDDNRQKFGPVTVPADRLFVLGDHRSHSSDSRAHIADGNNGTIPIDKVIGRAFVVIWPPGSMKGLRVPASLERTHDEQSLPAAPWTLAVSPPALGLAGAVPLTLARRRLRARRAARR